VKEGLAEPFVVDIPEATLQDLRARLRRARLAPDVDNESWRYGTNGDYLAGLLAYWADGFDWRAMERKINALPQERVLLDGIPIHYVHQRSPEPGAMPIILSHGWPWTFWDYHKVVGPLVDPVAHGGDARDAFHVVVPSLPGFGFSSPLRRSGVTWMDTADLFARVMTQVLGYDRFAAFGGDWGSIVTGQLGHKYPEHVIGIHNGTSALDIWNIERPWDLWGEMYNQAPQAMRPALRAYQRRFSSHVSVQVLDPQTLAHALHDSPAGLASWLVERRRTWSDCGGDVERRFTRDELLTHLTIYWATETLVTSVRYYAEAAAHPWTPSHDRTPRIEVPAGQSVFLSDTPTGQGPGRTPGVTFYREHERGGHFAPAEEPEAVVEDIREMFRPLR